jgi:signal transduction histidine kinase
MRFAVLIGEIVAAKVAMNTFLQSLKFQPTPFRFLLYAEWVMIATCFSFAVIESFEERSLPIQHVLVLAILSVMAAFLPCSKLFYKATYVGIEIALIFYGATLGYLHVLPTLYLIVLIQSCFLFKPLGRWIVAGLSFFLFLVHQVRYVQNITVLVQPHDRHIFWMHLIAEILMFGLGIFFVVKLVTTLLSERQAKDQLTVAHVQLRQYALQVEELASVRERNHIAREIHDSLGHTLTAQNIQLQTAVKLGQRDPHKVQPFIEQALRLATEAMLEVRRSVSTLRADVPEEPSLEEAIKSLVDDFRQGTGVSTDVILDVRSSIPPQLMKTLYRVVQEALTNISKHAHATNVKIDVSTTSEDVRLMIEDNGRGFQPDVKTRNKFGLRGMHERVVAIGGILHLQSELGAGCQIVVKIPLCNHAEQKVNRCDMPQPSSSYASVLRSS